VAILKATNFELVETETASQQKKNIRENGQFGGNKIFICPRK
jgi:hypothetical protein